VGAFVHGLEPVEEVLGVAGDDGVLAGKRRVADDRVEARAPSTWPARAVETAACASRLAFRRARRRWSVPALTSRKLPSASFRPASIGRPATVASERSGKASQPEVSPLGA
jgi:hypothetical protein